MDIRPISDKLSVSPQILPEDVSALKEQGFTSIICNRPDGEESGQPSFAQIKAAAAQAGMEAHTIPIGSSGASQADVAAFAEAVSIAPGPVLAYCRSGMRSTTLWALTQSGHLPSQSIIATARDAGYDLIPLSPRLVG
jgi:uncharacterized protein (TIGR01244 family)